MVCWPEHSPASYHHPNPGRRKGTRPSRIYFSPPIAHFVTSLSDSRAFKHGRWTRYISNTVSALLGPPHTNCLNKLFAGSTPEIDSFITHSQQFTSMSSQSNSRILSVLGLAMTRLQRHTLSNQKEDLDKAILHFTESILLPPRLWLEHGPLIHSALFLLALALVKRLVVSKLPEDAISAAKYLRYLVHQPHAAFGIPRHAVITMLVDVLNHQIKLTDSSVVQNIEEMAVLCHELLTSNASEDDTTHAVTLISEHVLTNIALWLPDRPVHQIIKCLRAARMHKPDHRQAHFALAVSLGTHYYVTFDNDDYEKAASVLDEIITSESLGDSRGEFVAEAQWFVTMLALTRSKTHEIPEYLEEAMYRTRAFHAASSSVKKPFRPPGPLGDFDLDDTAKKRFDYFGSIEGPEASSSNPPLSRPAPEMSFGKYEAELRQFEAEFSQIDKKLGLLKELVTEIQTSDMTKIHETLEKGRTILASSAPRDTAASCLFELFGAILYGAYKRTNKIEYLNESISTRRQVFERPLPQYLRFGTLHQIALSLLLRSKSFPGHRTHDLDEALELLSQCVNDGHASLTDRFGSACLWAHVARSTRHRRSIPTAYESALSLMEDILPFAPTLQLQHYILAASHYTHSMPLDYASYRVDLGNLDGAIETLERGRALLWSEMRNLRASSNQLLQTDPQLGHRFADINRELEELTKSIPPSHQLGKDDGAADGSRAVDGFGRFLLRQRGLLKERAKLISEIRALPGFENFLTSPSFDTLRSAASSGPIIMIIHSIWRSVILILLHDTSPSLISTPYDFYDRDRKSVV